VIRKSGTTFRALIGAWAIVAAIVVIACFLRSDNEPVASSVNARYEMQRPLAQLDVRGPLETRVEGAPVATLATSVAPAASSGQGRPEGTARIFGKITVRETSEPLPGVLVAIRENATWEYWTATTGASGDYEIPSLPAGTFSLEVCSGEADVIDEMLPAPTRLAAGQEHRIDVAVSRAGRVWGTVTDQVGRPVGGAKVILGTSESIITQFATLAAAQHPPLRALTDEHGSYAIRGVPFEREWLVWVDHDDHAPVLSPNFVLHATRPQVRMDVTLLTGTRITGRVLEPSRQPVAEAKVVCMPRYSTLLAPMRRAQAARDARSRSDGTFELAGLPPGDYQVLAFKDGYRIELKGTPVYPDGLRPIDGVELVLRQVTEGDHVVFGTVKDTSGAPVEGAKVGLAAVGLESLSFGGRDTQTGADGSFRFEGVSEGQFLLVTGKHGYRDATETATADCETRIALERCSSISGVVQRPDGTPADAFSVRVVRSGEGSASLLDHLESMHAGGSFEDATGHFELEDVAPGRALLEATAAGYAPARAEVEVPRGASVHEVVLRLPDAGATVRGRVTDRSGAPVKGASVTITERGDSLGSIAFGAGGTSRAPGATTDERRDFVLERLAPATYDVHVTHPDFAPALVASVVASSDRSVDADAVMTAGGTIQGRAPQSAMITIGGEAFSNMLATGEAGDFKIEHVPAGDYLLRAVVTDDRALTRAPDVHRRSLRVDEGQVTTVDLVDEDGQGRMVEGRTAAPSKGTVAMVVLRVPGSPSLDPGELIFQGQLGVRDPQASRFVVAESLVQPDGTFVLRGIPPGRYTQDVYVTTVLGTLSGKRATLKDTKEVVID
jgi:protocatechuate 3,4-dioxygenase beta subunit